MWVFSLQMHGIRYRVAWRSCDTNSEPAQQGLQSVTTTLSVERLEPNMSSESSAPTPSQPRPIKDFDLRPSYKQK